VQSDAVIEERIIQAIRKIIRANDLHSRGLAARYRITGPQLMALREIARVEGATPGALARAIHVSQSNVTGIVARLAGRGLVRRSRDSADRRVTTVTLTPGGRRMLAASPPLLQAGFRRELAGLKDWEKTTLLAALQRVSEMMRAAEEPGPDEPAGRPRLRSRKAGAIGATVKADSHRQP